MNLAARLARRPAPSTDVAELVESFRPRPEVAAPAAAALPAPAIGAPASIALGPDPLDVAVAVLAAERALLAVRGLHGEVLLQRVLGLVRAWLAAPSPSTWAEAVELSDYALSTVAAPAARVAAASWSAPQAGRLEAEGRAAEAAVYAIRGYLAPTTDVAETAARRADRERLALRRRAS